MVEVARGGPREARARARARAQVFSLAATDYGLSRLSVCQHKRGKRRREPPSRGFNGVCSTGGLSFSSDTNLLRFEMSAAAVRRTKQTI